MGELDNELFLCTGIWEQNAEIKKNNFTHNGGIGEEEKREQESEENRTRWEGVEDRGEGSGKSDEYSRTENRGCKT